MIRCRRSIKLLGHGSLLLVLMALGSMAPVTAQGTDGAQVSDEQFCTSLATVSNRLTTRITAAQDAAQHSWDAQSERLHIMSTQRTMDISNLRTEIDASHQKNLSTMQTLYAAQAPAVQGYSAAIHQATIQYRKSVDEALRSYQSAVENVMAKRYAARAGQVEGFRIGVTDALRAAKVDCSENPDSPTIQSTLRTKLVTSRTTFTNGIKADVTTQQLDGLIAKRDAAFNQAEQTVGAQLDAANQALKTALNQQ